MARVAEASGDHVARELYFQHADHYYRVMNERSQNAAETAAEPPNPQTPGPESQNSQPPDPQPPDPQPKS